MSRFTRRPETRSNSEKGPKSSSLKTKITIQKPTNEDYKNFPNCYVPGRPLLLWHKLRCVTTKMKRSHDWYIEHLWLRSIPSSQLYQQLLLWVAQAKVMVDFRHSLDVSPRETRHPVHEGVVPISVTHT
jgi:hypothetical protein